MKDQRSALSFVVVGDAMVDTVALIDGDLNVGSDHTAVVSRHVGGQAANTAAWLGWLQSPVTLIAACGSDPEAEWICERLGGAGVRTALHVTDAHTGRCVVAVAADASRTMFSEAGANTHLADIPEARWAADLREIGAPIHLHLSGYLLERRSDLLGSILATARRISPDTTTSMDAAALIPSVDHRNGLRSALPLLDVVLGTCEELSGLADMPEPTTSTGTVLEYWRDTLGFTGVVVAKEGPAGASALYKTTWAHVPALPAEVVDTTGAGDAFAAGFLAAWTLGSDDLAAAVLAGHEAASVAITRIGAGPPATEGR